MSFDVFLSHNSREKPVVERLAQRLKSAGIEPWLDKWCLTPGARWQDELARGLANSAACAVFIGPHDAGHWEREEVDLALDRAAKQRGFRVFLVLLPGVSEPFDPNGLSPFLSTRTWVDLRRGIDGSSFQALVNAIKGVPLTPAQPAAADASSAACPYRGLQPFDAEHSKFYFGRDSEVQRLLEQLKTTRFLCVLGPSGSGKSSLVKAGLLPALANGALPGSHEWPIQVFTPGADPLTQLTAQLLRFSGHGTMHDTLDRLAADPRTWHLASTLAMADRPATARIVWVIDQFEEIFTLCRSDAARAQFISNLLYAAAPEGRSVIVITLRADFYHRCAAHGDLAARVAGNQFLVGPMSREGLRQAIEEPARLTGLEFEEGLVDTILDEVDDQPGALPLVEYALFELWQRRRARMLTLEGYRDAGGVSQAIARRADAIYQAFDDTQRAVTRRLLMRLTHIGEGAEDTRRRAAMSELVTSREQTTVIEDVISVWTDARLLTLSADEAGERWVSVSHEALIREWPMLRTWIDEDRAGQRLHRQITEAAQEWQRLTRDESALLRGLRLAQAREFQAQRSDLLNELERSYLDASDAFQRAETARRDRTRRQVVVGLSAGIIVAVALATFAGWQWLRADREQRSATIRAITAQSDLLRTQAMASPPGWPDLLHRGSLLAIEARRLGADRDNARALRAAADAVGHPPRTIDVALDAVRGISAAANRVAVASPDGASTAVWDLNEGAVLTTIPRSAVPWGVMFSPSSRYLLVISESAVSAWLVSAVAQELWNVPATGGENNLFRARAAFAPNEKTVAVIDGTFVRLLDVATGRQTHQFEHPGAVSQVAFSADGRWLASSSGKMLSLFLISMNGSSRMSIETSGEIGWLAIDERGTRVATQHARHVDVWQTTTGDRIAAIDTLTGSDDVEYIAMVSLDETGSRLGVIGEYGTGQQFSVSPIRQLFELNYAESRWLPGPDPRFLGFKSKGAVEVWDLPAAQPILRVIHSAESEPQGFVFSPESHRLVVFDETRIWVYDTAPGTVVSRVAFGGSESWATVASSRDRRVWVIPHDAGVDVVDTAQGRIITRVPGQSDAVVPSRDGTLLMTRAREGTARVWNVSSDAREVWRGENLDKVSLSPNGRVVVGTGPDDAIRAWDRRPARRCGATRASTPRSPLRTETGTRCCGRTWWRLCSMTPPSASLPGCRTGSCARSRSKAAMRSLEIQA